MAKYAIVQDTVVTNYVEWDGVSQFNPDGQLIIDDGNSYIGGSYIDSAFIPKPPEEDTFTYMEKRQASYASTGDQLDMQYWDSVNDTTIWKDHIASVKAQFPKV